MADVAALVLATHDPASPMDTYPEPPQDRSSAISYSYTITSPSSKQAVLDRFLGLGDACAPPPAKETPDDTAYYRLQAAYERNDASSRRANEAAADEYERYRLLHDGDGDGDRQRRETVAGPERDVCCSCLRPFDDDGSKESKAVGDMSDDGRDVPAAGGVAFDAEMGMWKVRFARSVEREALRGEIVSATKTGVEEPPALDIRDGGYIDSRSQVQGDGSALVARKAAGDVMANYAGFLRSNHVVVMPSSDELSATMPTETESPTPAEVEVQDEDMDYVDVRDEEYLDYLCANHVRVDVAPAEKQAENKTETAVKALPVVNTRATRYEDYYDLGGGNVGPYEGVRLG